MFTKHATEEISFAVIMHWLMMTFAAGSLNSVAFIGLGTFATHVTGFATLFGIHVAESDAHNAFAALFVPVFFLSGAVISGLWIEGRIRHDKPPHYDFVMFLAAVLLFAGCAIGNYRNANLNAGYDSLGRNFGLLSLVCLASGLMNASLSFSSRSTVRVTHLTGITTDLGRGIAELIAVKQHKLRLNSWDRQLNLLRFLTIVFFALGSLAGAVLFKLFSFYALLLPAIYCLYAGEHGRRAKQKFINIDYETAKSG
jgi:uncharacterized membrane protein YoaK (UPF0700 family)